MKDKDIANIRKVLEQRGRSDLADLLEKSYLRINENPSDKFWNLLSISFDIYSPNTQYETLRQLDKDDNKEIKNVIHSVFKKRLDHPNVLDFDIDYFPDFDLEESKLVETDNLKQIDFDDIHEQINKCKNRINDKDYEGAVTTSKALLESICLFIYEKSKGEKYDYNGDLIKLYKEVSKILKMYPADYENGCLKQILSGVFSIINGISTLRNNFSDAHGRSPQKSLYKIDKRHAKLSVNLAKSIAEYLFLTYEKNEQKQN